MQDILKKLKESNEKQSGQVLKLTESVTSINKSLTKIKETSLLSGKLSKETNLLFKKQIVAQDKERARIKQQDQRKAQDAKRARADTASQQKKLLGQNKATNKPVKKGGGLGDLLSGGAGGLLDFLKAPAFGAALGAGLTGGLVAALAVPAVHENLGKAFTKALDWVENKGVDQIGRIIKKVVENTTGILTDLVKKLTTTASNIFYDKVLVPLGKWWSSININIPGVGKVGGAGVNPFESKNSYQYKADQSGQKAQDILNDNSSSSADRAKAEKFDSLARRRTQYDKNISEYERQIEDEEKLIKAAKQRRKDLDLSEDGDTPINRRIKEREDFVEQRRQFIRDNQAKSRALRKEFESLEEFKQGGFISGPQSGYPVSLDGGRTASFIGHGTEYVAQKSNGGFVVPIDTPSTKGNPGLTKQRMGQAQGLGFNLGGMNGYSNGGELTEWGVPKLSRSGVNGAGRPVIPDWGAARELTATKASHPDTGEGWSIGKDGQGRPAIFAKAAADALLKVIKDSNGEVKSTDITSSTRSPAKNEEVGGVANSNHLYGNAVDIHGSSKRWLKGNGLQYGWKNLVYSGHDGHFDFINGGSLPTQEGGERTSKGAPNNILQNMMSMGLSAIKNVPIIGDFVKGFERGFNKGLDPNSAAGAIAGLLFGGGSGGGGGGGGGGGNPNAAAAQLSGDTQAKAKMMYEYIKSKGYTSAQAKGIVANIHRESTFNPTARSGDDNGPGGLFQWKGGRQTPTVAGLVNSGNWKGQIDYALQEDVGPRYKGATSGMNAFDASMWWAREWERPASLQNARNKHSSFLGGYGFSAGGPVRAAAGGNIGDALLSEMVSKPAGSDLVIANSSETIIPAGASMMRGRQNGNGWIDASMDQSSRPTIVVVNSPPAGGGGGGGSPGVTTPSIPPMSNAPTSPIAGLLMTQTYLMADRIG